jgi:DNA-binding response OmpR family regulator
MKKILIIEDEKILAEMYKERFEKEGFEVFLATTSKKGLKLAREKNPDLILLDILLPDEDGISFLKELRKDPSVSEILVVALSNYDDPKAKKDAFNLGAKEYLIKTDYTPKQVVERVKKYLE